ncbi:MAG: carboxypeptidase regulatory-like domain-containing protein [bacterium]|nr:carboxypeptidase regulatory-like domain-containing protein [Candidatus Margulisiibacteriota bacterium]
MLKKKFVSLCFGLLLICSVLFVFGCSSSVKSELSVTQGEAKGLVITGTVRALKGVSSGYGSLSSYVETGVVSGAAVSLSGFSDQTTISNEDGTYTFSNISPGTYTVVVSKEGFQSNSVTRSFVENPSDNTILTVDVGINDNPFIVSIGMDDPESPSAVKVEFSEPIDTSMVVADLSYNGARTYSIAFGVLEVVKSWNEAKTVLTLTPAGGMIDDTNYTLQLNGITGDFSGITDLAGNSLDSSGFPIASLGGYISGFGYKYMISVNLLSTATSDTPTTAPTNLRILTSTGTSEIDFVNVNYYNDGLTLTWDSVSGATGYDVYCRIADGPFQRYSRVPATAALVCVYKVDESLAEFSRIEDLSWSSYPGEGESGIVWPFIGDYAVDFKVVPFNSAGNGPESAIITVRDSKNPSFLFLGWSATTVTLTFSEPLDDETAENVANYTIADQTITAAELTNSYTSSGYGRVVLTCSPGFIAPPTVSVSIAVTDLSGNGVE